jgi:excisionase family DNA binding protein
MSELDREPLVDVKAVAARLAVSVRSVWRRVSEGDLHPVRVGRLARFSESDLAEYMRRNQMGGQS